MPTAQIPGHALVTRRALTDVARSAALRAYGVTGFGGGGLLGRVLDRLGLRTRGVRVALRDGEIRVSLQVSIAHGLPIAEVARQVEASVRYGLREAVGQEPASVSIRVASLREQPGRPLARPADSDLVGPSELAVSGTDVA